MHRRSIALVVLTASAKLIAGCATSGEPSGSASAATASVVAESAASAASFATSSATATPVATASPSPTPGPSPKALCSTGDGVFPPKTCALAPGTYSAAPFAPVFRFTIGAGWSNTLAGMNGGNLVAGKDSQTQFSWATGKATGMVTQDGTDVGKTTDAFLRYVAAVPGIVATPPTPLTIGGMPARSVDVMLTTNEIFLMIGKSAMRFQTGEKVRLIVVDVSGTVVSLAIEVTNPKDFDAAVTLTQPILDSIAWN